MTIDILQSIIERRKYPILGKSMESEIKYTSDILSNATDRTILVFPLGVLNKPRSQTIQLREMLFRDWKVAGIFDAGTIFAPETSIQFSILYLQRIEPAKIRFGVFANHTFASYPKRRRQDGSLGDLPTISETYRNYLTSIAEIAENNSLPQSRKEFRFYEIDATRFDDSQLNTRFYDPELTENEEKIRRERWVHLGEVADILQPKPISEPARLLSPTNFEYPFPEYLPTNDSGTDITLQRGDIVVSSVDVNQSFLVTITPASDVRPSRFMYIIRPRSDVVSPYYLFLYLKSDTARKYAMRYERGTFLRRIDRRTLLDFPIVVPSLNTQRQSFQLFEQLFLKKGDDPIAKINRFLFTPQSLPQKVIQREFILEVIENLQQSKRELLTRLLMTDFDEVEKCLEVHAYKSCLILCGSILEVVLLDWLSEVEKNDYFASSKDIKLFWMIERLKDKLGDAYIKANNIRDRRNLVHPKQLLKSSTEINDAVCRDVISDLKDVLRQRGLDTKMA